MDDRWILVGICLVAALYFFWIKPAKEGELEDFRTAAKIAKYFGDTEIKLFRFCDTYSDGQKRLQYVMIEYNDWTDASVLNCKKHYTIGNVPDTEKGRKQMEKTLKNMAVILPYSVSIRDADVPFSEYKYAVQRLDGNNHF